MTTATQLACPSPGIIEWREVELRDPKAGEVLVRPTHGVEKHGTMAGFVKGYANARGTWDWTHRMHVEGGEMVPYPVPLGNMQFGETETGARVAWFGPFQDAAVVAESALFPIDGLDWRDAAMLDPGIFGVGAMRDGAVRMGDDVAVFGLGAIGLGIVQLALAAGANRVFALDPIASRRAVAAGFGAHPIDAEDAGLALREATGMRGVDVAIDYSGSWRALQAAFRGTGYGGTIAYGAFPAPFPAGLDLGAEAHYNRQKLVFTRVDDPDPEHPRWSSARITETVWEFIRRGTLRGQDIVDAPVRFEDLAEVYPEIAAHPEAHLKLSVEYPR